MFFIDLKKAFDTVDPYLLLDIMHHCGIYGLEHNGSVLISKISGSAAKSTVSHPTQQKLILGYHKDLALDLFYFCLI